MPDLVPAKRERQRKVRSDRWEPTEEQISLLKKMAGFGMPVNQMAAMLDISKNTLDLARQRDDRVAKAIEKGRSEMSFDVRRNAANRARSGKSDIMTIFWLKTREGFTENRFEDEGNEDSVGRAPLTLNYKR